MLHTASLAKKVNSANDDAGEIEFDSQNGEDDGEHNCTSFLERMVNTLVLVLWRYLKYLQCMMQFLLERYRLAWNDIVWQSIQQIHS